ncbi:hypothetical protein PRIPAC_76055 [Pristionchus pacificus]|nr:hypothetical protein PRIPAC_76055 [Pristionchus pacificus]
MTTVTTRSRGNIFMKKEAYSPSRPARATSSCSSASSTSSTSSNSMEAASHSTPCVRRPVVVVPRPLFEKNTGTHLSRKFLPEHIPRSDFTLPPEYLSTPKTVATKKTPKPKLSNKRKSTISAALIEKIVKKAHERESISPPPVLELETYIDENVEAPRPAKLRCLHSKVAVKKEDLRKKLTARWSTRVTEEKRARGEERASPKIVLSISTLQCHLCTFSTLSASSLIAHLSSAPHETSLLHQGRLLRCSSCGTYVKDAEQERSHRGNENAEREEDDEVEMSMKCPEKWTIVAIRPSHAAHLLKSSQ